MLPTHRLISVKGPPSSSSSSTSATSLPSSPRHNSSFNTSSPSSKSKYLHASKHPLHISLSSLTSRDSSSPSMAGLASRGGFLGRILSLGGGGGIGRNRYRTILILGTISVIFWFAIGSAESDGQGGYYYYGFGKSGGGGGDALGRKGDGRAPIGHEAEFDYSSGNRSGHRHHGGSGPEVISNEDGGWTWLNPFGGRRPRPPSSPLDQLKAEDDLVNHLPPPKFGAPIKVPPSPKGGMKAGDRTWTEEEMMNLPMRKGPGQDRRAVGYWGVDEEGRWELPSSWPDPWKGRQGEGRAAGKVVKQWLGDDVFGDDLLGRGQVGEDPQPPEWPPFEDVQFLYNDYFERKQKGLVPNWNSRWTNTHRTQPSKNFDNHDAEDAEDADLARQAIEEADQVDQDNNVIGGKGSNERIRFADDEDKGGNRYDASTLDIDDEDDPLEVSHRAKGKGHEDHHGDPNGLEQDLPPLEALDDEAGTGDDELMEMDETDTKRRRHRKRSTSPSSEEKHSSQPQSSPRHAKRGALPSPREPILDPNTFRPILLNVDTLYRPGEDEWKPLELDWQTLGVKLRNAIGGKKTKTNGLPRVQWDGFSRKGVDGKGLKPDGRVPRPGWGWFGKEAKRAAIPQDEGWETKEERETRNHRKDWVRKAFGHVWAGYKRHGWGHDETKPLTHTYNDPFNGWGCFIVDALDTLLVLNLTHEYTLARTHISHIDFTLLAGTSSAYSGMSRSAPTLPMFETSIRYFGGLLSAYDLSGDELMLERARELADIVLPAFATKSGLPIPRYRIGSDPQGGGSGRVVLSEVGSMTLEYTRLWQLTGDEKYFHAVQRATDFLDKNFSMENTNRMGTLLPTYLSPENPDALHGTYSFSAQGDSYYEYLIKQHQLLRGSNPQYGRMYADAIDSAWKYLIREIDTIPGEKFFAIGATHYGTLSLDLDHLACFTGAMMGLGAKLLNRPRDLEGAKGLADGCWWSYRSSATGLGAESMTLYPDTPERFRPVQAPDGQAYRELKGNPPGVKRTDARYQGRPEAIESIFYMWRITGDRKWQDIGWRMFVAWVEQCMTESGFASIVNVYDKKSPKSDSMESFVMAETLKYYYLLFSDPDFMSLDDYVFNTEAHPLRIPKPSSETPFLWKGPQAEFDPRYSPPYFTDQTKNNDPEAMLMHRGQGTAFQQWQRVKALKESRGGR